MSLYYLTPGSGTGIRFLLRFPLILVRPCISYIRLATFRKSGEAVSTPVWFAAVGGKLYLTTSPDSRKAKRISNNPSVRVAPSTPMGKSLGPFLQATARILPPEEQAQAERALLGKYGLQLRILSLVWRPGGHKHIFLEITPRRT